MFQTQFQVPPGAYDISNFLSVGVTTQIASSGSSSPEGVINIGDKDFFVTSICVTVTGEDGVHLHALRDTSDIIMVNLAKDDGTSYTGSPVDFRAMNKLSENNPLWRGWIVPKNTKIRVTSSHIAVGTSVITFGSPLRVSIALSGYKFISPQG